MSVANGGTNSPDNLYTACVACNLGKGSRVLKTESSDDLSTEEWIVEARIGFEEIVGSPPHDADIENYAIRASVFAYGIDTVLQVFERHADAFKFSDASRLAAFGRLILLCHEDLEREWAEIDAWRRKNEDGYV